ncbi:hypothetical protein HAX54_035909 [Datura stramonium]|uniref:Uncharacterized protein n=1 Tax=Datura stramonium TaxID=4076 RepID=A0ABS8VHE3_DATST|nr:hypothetical protein [Datura stramonium]
MGFTRRLVTKEDQCAWVRGIITEDQPHWVVMNGDIHRQDLKFKARMWLDLVDCPLFQPLDKMQRVEEVIDLAIKGDKDTPVFKRLRLTLRPSDSLLTKVLGDTSVLPLEVAGEIHYSEPPRDEVFPTMASAHHGDTYLVLPVYSYYEAMTLPNKWVVTLPQDPIVLPLDPLMPSMVDIAS